MDDSQAAAPPRSGCAPTFDPGCTQRETQNDYQGSPGTGQAAFFARRRAHRVLLHTKPVANRKPVKCRHDPHEVESYLQEKFKDDQDAKRLQRKEIVLKKFGLLDRDFNLKPFLLALLKEQIEAYYDSKTKTVNMLDWVSIDEQKPVLAHELTHALQDQHSDLEKWNDQTPSDVSTDFSRRYETTSQKTRRWTPPTTPLPKDKPPPS